MPGYIYVLHFDEPLCHAEHYVGCTTELRERLTSHANGRGARICEALRDIGIGWNLSNLFTCNVKQMRRLERQFKNMKNTSRFCPYCTPGNTVRLDGTVPMDVSLCPFPTNSRMLLTGEYRPMLSTRYGSEHEPPQTLAMIKHLMSMEKEALGFVPAGEDEGIKALNDAGSIIIGRIGTIDVGYLMYTVCKSKTQVNIHQCITRDAVRRQGLASMMVQTLRDKYGETPITAKVREDLIANEFWKAIGFKTITTTRHRTSKNVLNVYATHNISPDLYQ
jgi:predicted GIY-YIG superfamily endonuclease